MTGFLLLGVVALWLVISAFVSVFVYQKLPTKPWRIPLAVIFFIALAPLPIADEIIGGYQFRTLCEQYAVQFIDEQHAQGRRILSASRGGDKFAEGTAVRIRIDPWLYKDAESGKTLVSYHTLHATGGWLIRVLGISETKRPLIFEPSCGPANERAFLKKYNMTVVN